MSACPECRFFNSRVNETRRLANGWIRRHRRCLEDECGARWYTYEIPRDSVSVSDPDLLQPVENDDDE